MKRGILGSKVSVYLGMKTGLYIYCIVNIPFNLMITNRLVTLLRPIGAS